jgi:prolyl oligopeptidase
MKKLTGVNSSLQDLTSYRTEIVKWKSSDGLEMYGILRYKNNQDPLIVNVHGGPTGFSPVTFLDRSTPFIPGGYSIFYPNYRGSIGKGRSFAEANRGDMGGKDLQDILSGIEYLRKSGKVKTESVFITGGSYGGFMTSWAVTQTDIFTAAVGLFGITDWISFHGVTNIPAWDAIHYNQSPYSRDLFEKFSPLNYLDKVKTPILLQHGIEDPCVPVGQYLQFYRGLKDKGKTVRLILYPREGHGFLERKHIIMQFEESLRWFDRYRSR